MRASSMTGDHSMTPPPRTETADLDPLSEALGNCSFQCRLFERLELNPPWGMAVPDGIVAFYAILGGTGRAVIERARAEMPFSEGDLLVLPQSFGHVLDDGPGCTPLPVDQLLAAARPGSPGATRMVACHLALPRHCSYLVRLALPPVIRVSSADGQKSPGLSDTLRLMMWEAESRRPGSQGIIDRLAQVVFIHAIRAFLSESPGIDACWPSALLNPSIAMALTLIHQFPDKPWTVASLASAVVMSRSAFADRFTELVGASPIQYLTERRMHAACQLLHDPDIGLAQIASRVGYRSTAAFSHAFRRWAGLTPGTYRRAAGDHSAAGRNGSQTFSVVPPDHFGAHRKNTSPAAGDILRM